MRRISTTDDIEAALDALCGADPRLGAIRRRAGAVPLRLAPPGFQSLASIVVSQQVSRELEAHFGDKVFRTLVPRNVRLAEAPSYGVPAVLWDPGSKGAQAYIALAGEVLEREVAYS